MGAPIFCGIIQVIIDIRTKCTAGIRLLAVHFVKYPDLVLAVSESRFRGAIQIKAFYRLQIRIDRLVYN